LGAFDNDKTLGRGEILTERYQVGDEFILHSVEYIGQIDIPNSDLGATDKVILNVTDKADPDQNQSEVSAIGSVAEKLKDANESELPAVVKLISFTSKTYGTEGRTVQWVRDWTQEEADSLKVPF